MPPMTMTISSQAPDRLCGTRSSARPSSPAAGADSCSCARGTRSVRPSIVARTMPGMTPAMNSAPDRGVGRHRVHHHRDRRRDQDAERARTVVMTPAPKRFGKPALDHRRQEDRADRDDRRRRRPETAANSAQASTPARPSPPCQWPTIERREADHPLARRRRGSGSCRRG